MSRREAIRRIMARQDATTWPASRSGSDLIMDRDLRAVPDACARVGYVASLSIENLLLSKEL